jgi:hypothetical protein
MMSLSFSIDPPVTAGRKKEVFEDVWTVSDTAGALFDILARFCCRNEKGIPEIA